MHTLICTRLEHGVFLAYVFASWTQSGLHRARKVGPLYRESSSNGRGRLVGGNLARTSDHSATNKRSRNLRGPRRFGADHRFFTIPPPFTPGQVPS